MGGGDDCDGEETEDRGLAVVRGVCCFLRAPGQHCRIQGRIRDGAWLAGRRDEFCSAGCGFRVAAEKGLLRPVGLPCQCADDPRDIPALAGPHAMDALAARLCRAGPTLLAHRSRPVDHEDRLLAVAGFGDLPVRAVVGGKKKQPPSVPGLRNLTCAGWREQVLRSNGGVQDSDR